MEVSDLGSAQSGIKRKVQYLTGEAQIHGFRRQIVGELTRFHHSHQ